MKTTSIFPVHGLASLILISKYVRSRNFFGVSLNYLLININEEVSPILDCISFLSVFIVFALYIKLYFILYIYDTHITQ